MIRLRDYQEKIIADVRSQIRAGYTRILIQLACGGGKTAIAGNIMKTTTQNGFNAMFAAHREELCSQACKTMKLFGVKHGVIQSGAKMDFSPLMQVASIGTLKNRLGKTPVPKVLVIDEAQHLPSKSWQAVSDHYHQHGAIIIGLSATPIRLSGEVLSGCFDVMVQGPTIKELMEMGHLCRYKYYAPAPVMDLSSVSVKYGDYVKGELEVATNKSHITGDCIQHYQRLLPGKRAIVFCISVSHAQAVAAQFKAAGIPAEAVDGNLSKDDRLAAKERFERGETLILANCEIYGEGVDLPAVEGVILLRPTMSESLFIQQTGRALRPDPMNPAKVAVILDHCNNVQRHGLPCDDREWSLEGVRKRPKGDASNFSIRQCLGCYRVHLPAPVCPHCGYVYPVESREIKQTTGELAEIKEIERKQKWKELNMCKTMAELKEYADAHGYNKGWIWHRAKAKGIKS